MAHIEVENDELVIRIPLNVTPVLSSTGKTHMVDSTHGFTNVSTPFGQVAVSVNATTKDAANWGKNGQRRPAAAPGLVKNGHNPAPAPNASH